jgi:hypothetical protein
MVHIKLKKVFFHSQEAKVFSINLCPNLTIFVALIITFSFT